MATHEILTLRNQKASAIRILSAVREAVDGKLTSNYIGRSDWLVVFGWGGNEQQNALRQHRKSGRPVLVIDYSFFTREKNRFRIAVNDYFPTNHLIHAQGGERFGRAGIELDNLGEPEGRIVLLELTPKSCAAFGYELGGWERNQIGDIRRAYGDREIAIRPKRKNISKLKLPVIQGGSIADAIRGAGLVVVHHSNVAVDCAIHGVDCVASHGVGAGFYPARVGDNPYRTPAERKRFLEQVAWFDWSLDEVGEMMEWAHHINEVTQ